MEDRNAQIKELYARYYTADRTPEDCISSHWRDFSDRIEFNINDKDDVLFADEEVPYYRYFFSLKPPFVRYFDGPMHHRLVRLKTFT